MTKERLDFLIIEEGLTKQEKKLFTKILYNREKALIWEFVEIRKVRLEVIFFKKFALFYIRYGV